MRIYIYVFSLTLINDLFCIILKIQILIWLITAIENNINTFSLCLVDTILFL